VSAQSERGGRPAQPLRRLSGPAAWSLHHRVALAATLERLRADRLGSALVALTLGVALALPGLLGLTVSQLGGLAADWTRAPRVNVFVEAPEAETRVLLARLRDNPGIAAVDWQPPADSLDEFASAAGFGEALADGIDALGGNPLPGVALVTPAESARAPARLRALASRLEGEPGVVGVQVDLDWVLRLAATLDLLTRLTWGLAALLAGGVLLVVGSLTRSALEQRRDEIVVLRLVGGTDPFVRRPFLYQGALQGAAGGLAAWLILALVFASIASPVEQLARSYGSGFRLEGPGAGLGLALVAGAAGLGWLGARIAAGRTLRRIEP
jgi:cell division transport system permease protein